MFYFRVNKIKIFDNKSSFLFWDRSAKIKILSFITQDNTSLNDLSELFDKGSRENQEAFIKDEVKKLVQSQELIEVTDVKDNHIFTFGDSGYVFYSSKNVPEYFNWLLLLVESDKEFQDICNMLLGTMGSSAFSMVLNEFMGVIKASPLTSFYSNLSTFVVKNILNVASTNKDDIVGLLYTSLNKVEHYPHLVRNSTEVPDLTGNMEIDYSIFGYEETKLSKKHT